MGLVNSTASFLVECFHLRNPESIDPMIDIVKDAARAEKALKATPMLGALMDEEMRHKATKSQLDHLESLRDSYEFAVLTDRTAMALIVGGGVYQGMHRHTTQREVRGNGNASHAVQLKKAAESEAYYFMERHPSGHGAPITLGGIGHALYRECLEHAERWLHACDRKLCTVHDDNVNDCDHVDELIRTLALAIAGRMTLHYPVEQGDDHLSTKALEARADMEYMRTRTLTVKEVKKDTLGLRALMVIARDGGESSEARVVLNKNLSLLRHIVLRPPPELAIETEEQMNMHFLRNAIVHEMPDACRVSLVTSWSKQHGACAQTTIWKALCLLQEFEGRMYRPVFPTVVCKEPSNVAMPHAAFAPCAGRWHAMPAPTRAHARTGLDFTGRRCVRIVAMVLQMTAHGAFEDGFVHKSIAATVCMEAISHARFMREIIEHERARCSIGVRMLFFEESLNDASSELADDLAKAMCNLSLHSFVDIYEAFSPVQPLLAHTIQPLTNCVRAILGESDAIVPRSYTHVARDGLGLLLPVICRRRQALGLCPSKASHPLADILRTVEVLKTWSPLKGHFRLTVAMTKKAHRDTIPMLEAYMKQPHIGKPLVVKTQRPKQAAVYTFDSMQLIHLLKL